MTAMDRAQKGSNRPSHQQLISNTWARRGEGPQDGTEPTRVAGQGKNQAGQAVKHSETKQVYVGRLGQFLQGQAGAGVSPLAVFAYLVVSLQGDLGRAAPAPLPVAAHTASPQWSGCAPGGPPAVTWTKSGRMAGVMVGQL